MSYNGVQVYGLRNLKRTMRQAGVDVKQLSKINREAASFVANASRLPAPKRSGRLAASIRAGATQKAGVVRAGRKSLPYANPIHWGWFRRGIRPQPWLSNTAQATESGWRPLYEQHMNDVIDQVKGL